MTQKTMAIHYSFTLFHVFFYFLIMSTLAWPHMPHAVVDIRNDLPNNTAEQLTLRCGEDSSFNLKLGDHHNRTLTMDQDLECTAVWSRWFTTWNAYEAKRYQGQDTVFWLVRKDGFYRSWDGSKWKRVGYWYTD
ncbi:hypothetical protein RIF29_40521 [Crotalaria pallida]|uniref:Plant self-incompatibility S1 n=1 Tax=Crotalaria pallida TaxID=3830 RepID=A0AAN9HUE1_CROPI